MTEPRTAAGRALWNQGNLQLDSDEQHAEMILAIEAEAAALPPSAPAGLDGPDFGRIFGKVMQQNPKADIRLVNAVLREVAAEYARLEQDHP